MEFQRFILAIPMKGSDKRRWFRPMKARSRDHRSPADWERREPSVASLDARRSYTACARSVASLCPPGKPRIYQPASWLFPPALRRGILDAVDRGRTQDESLRDERSSFYSWPGL